MEENRSWIQIIRNNVVYIVIVVYVFYFWVNLNSEEYFDDLLYELCGDSASLQFVVVVYGGTIWSILILLLICLFGRKNRFILRSFLPKGKGRKHKVYVVEDTYKPTQNNTVKMLLLGLLIGFVTNFICIACAMIHGDISLYFEFDSGQIPLFLLALLLVLVQSSSEEMWIRGFMYERILIHYPLWVAIAVNGVFFGLLHLFNPGVTFLSILNIILIGMVFSLIRWYTGSIWAAIGWHTMWNFTQNFIFGLPNSGVVSEFSLYHMESQNAESNLIYDYDFGVEGAIILTLISTLFIVVILLLAKRKGRLGELRMSYEKMRSEQRGNADDRG